MIDLRSDTVTKPTKEMLDAMMTATVGDSLFEEDPTVNALQAKAAEMFGMDGALYCPSGTMTNQIAVNVHTQPGGEIICDKYAHVYYHEGGGMMFNSGISACLLDGDRGQINASDVLAHINPDDIHRPETMLVEVENTNNMGGGCCYDFDELKKISDVCKTNNLKFHLDGARLFNALVETPERPVDYGKIFDSVSICLSKGLGAPVGSLILGNHDFLKQAKRVRKRFGGAMRQAGYIAAAGLYALENNIERLKDDHRRAKSIERVLNSLPYIESVSPVETNIIYFSLKNINSKDFLAQLAQKDIHAFSIDNKTIRFVTHLDIDDEMINYLEKQLINFQHLS